MKSIWINQYKYIYNWNQKWGMNESHATKFTNHTMAQSWEELITLLIIYFATSNGGYIKMTKICWDSHWIIFENIWFCQVSQLCELINLIIAFEKKIPTPYWSHAQFESHLTRVSMDKLRSFNWPWVHVHRVQGINTNIYSPS